MTYCRIERVEYPTENSTHASRDLTDFERAQLQSFGKTTENWKTDKRSETFHCFYAKPRVEGEKTRSRGSPPQFL